MKKYIYIITFFSFQLAAHGQTVNVHFKNGQQIQYNADNVDYVDFSEKAADPTLSAGKVVDLGLSVYWASCNLGAEKPEESGEYYAWGETKPKSKYSESNYSYYNDNTASYIDIGNNISGTSYDAATFNLGNDWRIPTKDEMDELKNKCKWEWKQVSGINGFMVTGPNGNTIFLPASGYHYSYISHLNEDLAYWTATPTSSKTTAYALQGHSSFYDVFSAMYRYAGYSIRPVTSNPNASSDTTDHSNDYIVTDKVTASYLGGSMSTINGIIQAGSQLNVLFNNGSSQSVTLVGIQLVDAATSSESNNMLSGEVEVKAGESISYTVTVGSSGVDKPIIRFTYRYNKKNYVAEAKCGF